MSISADKAPNRVILHVDLDYFYAQVEEREHPEYRGRPVVVCVYSGRTSESGAVSTANYIAREFKVKSGMPIAFAKRYLRDQNAVFVPANHLLYKVVSDEVTRILRSYASKFEQVGIDEAYLDVTERSRGDFGSGEALARQLKNEVRKKQGLTCSVGVASNKLVAKIAANEKKPDGLTVVSSGQEAKFLAPLPVGRLHGVGKKTEKVLLEQGVKTIGGLADYPLDKLVNMFGGTLGLYFHETARGLDDSPVQERGMVRSISRITTLRTDTREKETLLSVAGDLSKEVWQSLASRKFGFRTVGLIIIAEDMSLLTKSLTFDSVSSDLQTLQQAAKRLLETHLRDSDLKVRRLGVRITNLSSLQSQKSLSIFV